jgi:hypothetical protein
VSTPPAQHAGEYPTGDADQAQEQHPQTEQVAVPPKTEQFTPPPQHAMYPPQQTAYPTPPTEQPNPYSPPAQQNQQNQYFTPQHQQGQYAMQPQQHGQYPGQQPLQYISQPKVFPPPGQYGFFDINGKWNQTSAPPGYPEVPQQPKPGKDYLDTGM